MPANDTNDTYFTSDFKVLVEILEQIAREEPEASLSESIQVDVNRDEWSPIVIIRSGA